MEEGVCVLERVACGSGRGREPREGRGCSVRAMGNQGEGRDLEWAQDGAPEMELAPGE